MFKFYFVDQITGWLILGIQIFAVGFAVYQYYKWKDQRSEEDKHEQLKEINKTVLLLKNSVINLHNSLLSSYRFWRYKDENTREDFEDILRDYTTQFNKQVSHHLVELQVQSDIIKNYHRLFILDQKIFTLITLVKDFKTLIYQLIVEVVSEDVDDIKLETSITISEFVEGPIKEEKTDFRIKIDKIVDEINEEINKSSELIIPQ